MKTKDEYFAGFEVGMQFKQGEIARLYFFNFSGFYGGFETDYPPRQPDRVISHFGKGILMAEMTNHEKYPIGELEKLKP